MAVRETKQMQNGNVEKEIEMDLLIARLDVLCVFVHVGDLSK